MIATFKRLRRQPGLVVVCTLTLAVGLGACTTVFSLFNAVLLRELPYGDAERLVYIWAPHRLLPGLPLNATVGSRSGDPGSLNVTTPPGTPDTRGATKAPSAKVGAAHSIPSSANRAR